MKKAMLTFLALTLVMGFAANDSKAAQMCWNFVGYTSVIKVSVTPTLHKHSIIDGTYFVPGTPPTIFGNVLGTFEFAADNVHKTLAFSEIEPTGRTCFFSTNLSPTTTPKWEGSGSLLCTDGTINTYSMQRVNCSTYVPLAASAVISSEKGIDPTVR